MGPRQVADTLGETVAAAPAPERWIYFAVFGPLALGLAVGGLAYYRSEAAHIRQARYEEIAAVADLKAQSIRRWRQGQLIEARRAAQSRPIREALSESPAGLGVEALKQLHLELGMHGYAEARLVDVQGKALLSTHADSPAPDPIERGAIAGALASGTAALSDLFRGADGQVYLDAVAPVRDADERIRGLLALRIAAVDYLYPLIQSWPTRSPTAETLLVRREGDQVLFLNDLRHRSGVALKMRLPLAAMALPASRAVLGQRGMFEGRDYRGVPVVADLRPIPESPWFMVAKVDAGEVWSEARYRAAATAFFVLLSILLAAAATGYVYRGRRVAERRRAEEALGALAARQEALLAAIPDIVMEVDRNKVYTWANRAGLEFFGEEVVGNEAAHYFEGEQDTYDAVRPIFGGQEDTIYVESWQRRKDGENRLLAWWCRALKDARGDVTGALSSGRDITELRRQEQDLREKNAELERFTYTVSHDLKSPLVTIRAFLGFLERDIQGGGAERIAEDMAYMRNAAERMARLLDELLELSRIGSKPNLPEEIPLQAVVEEALGLVAGRIAERGVRVDVAEQPLQLVGDRPRLVELLQNLLENAVKFMGEQETPRIEVGVERRGAETVICVRDNGLGIDPRHQAKVFGLFEKLHTDTEGTGVGLAIVRRIVEVHGGRIWVESGGVNHGATFCFTLPGSHVGRGRRKP